MTVVGFAQTHQGFALDPPPFEKGGPKHSIFHCMDGIKKKRQPQAGCRC